MLKEKPTTFASIGRIVDLMTIVVSFGIAVSICESNMHREVLRWSRGASLADKDGLHQYTLLILLSLIAWIAATSLRRDYRSHRSEHLWPFLIGHLSTGLFWMILVGFLAFICRLDEISGRLALTFLLLSIAMLTIRQLGVRTLLQTVRRKGLNIRRVVVIGRSERAREFTRFIEKEGGPGYQVKQLSQAPDGRLDGDPDQDFDEAFLTIGDTHMDLEATVLRLVKLGKRVNIVPGVSDDTLFRQSFDEFAGVPVLSIGAPGIGPVEAAAKRLVDVAVSVILLLLLFPLLLFSAMLVRLSSQGPIFFSQERLGKNGRKFRMLKFRTMYRDAEERLSSDPELFRVYLENNHKVPSRVDPRITRFGRFLRTMSFDELPQLFNVLKGDMSLVGPRPITPPQLQQYGEYGPLFLSVKPGITGYWQVRGRSEITDFSRRAALDMEYISDQSLKVDVNILLKTIPAVLRRKGAY